MSVNPVTGERFWHISIQSTMTLRPLLLLAVGLVAGVAGGFVAGRNLATRARQTATESNPTATVQIKAGAAKARRPLDTGAVAAPDTAGFESRLRGASSGPMRKRWDNLRDLAKSVSPGDEQNALAMAEKI